MITMRAFFLVACVILGVSSSVQAQEKRPKATLLYYNDPSQYYDYHYGPELINIPEMRAGSVGMMPPGCTFSFYRTYQERWGVPQAQQAFVLVNVRCPCGTVRQLSFKISDIEKRFAKCKEGDILVFEGKFQVVRGRSAEPGGTGVFVVVGADNNSSLSPARNGLDVPKQK